jgi:RNA polymerase sigma factor (TIGR02999 family)
MTDPQAGEPRDPSLFITAELRACCSGDPAADERLAHLVYEPLRAIAMRQLRHERPDAELDTNGLVHEAYITLTHQAGAQWRDREHFYAVAARVMRRILVDHARRQHAIRRGGGRQAISLEQAPARAIAVEQRADELIALDEALAKLEHIAPRLSQVVECRFFAGLSEEETAQVLGVTTRTVSRDWAKAREWLQQQLQSDE